jgi:hypothetical protein
MNQKIQNIIQNEKLKMIENSALLLSHKEHYGFVPKVLYLGKSWDQKLPKSH